MRPKKSLTFDEGSAVEISVAPNAGACFGVVRAIKLGHKALRREGGHNGPVYSFGPLIHNPIVVDDFKGRGITIVEHPEEVQSGTVLLRSHGVQREVESELHNKSIQIIDATCPLVKKPQRIAASVKARGYFLVIVGNAQHPEIKGVLSYFGNENYLVTYDPQDLQKVPETVTKLAILAQTTIEFSVFDRVTQAAKAKFQEVLIYNTICDATSVRQAEALKLAKEADIMIVIGGKDSSNTNKLVKICRTILNETYHIEQISEVEPLWFVGKRKIGVTGGASTPHEYVDQVADHIASLFQPQQVH